MKNEKHAHSHSHGHGHGHGHSHGGSHDHHGEHKEHKHEPVVELSDAHRHGPKCGHVAVHHYTASGQSHLAFVNEDATTECFNISSAEEGCCNMRLTKVDHSTESKSCDIADLLPQKPVAAEGSKHDECKKNHASQLQQVARGNGVALYFNQTLGTLVIESSSDDLDQHEHDKCCDTEEKEADCPVVGILKKDIHDTELFCPKRFSQVEELVEKVKHEVHELQKKQKDSCCENDHGDEHAIEDDIWPSICTGMWSMVFHSTDCGKSQKHTVVPVMKHHEEHKPSLKSTSVVTSVLQITNMCCSMEAKLVTKALKHVPGVQSVSINIPMKTTRLVHDAEVFPAEHAVDILNKQKLGAILMSNGKKQPDLIKNADEDDVKSVKMNLFSFNWDKLPNWNVSLALLFVMISLLQYVSAVDEMEYFKYVALLSVALCLPSILQKSITRLSNYTLDITTLMSIACIGAIALQEYTEAAAVITLYALSDWLESIATSRIRDAVTGLVKLKPTTAILTSTNQETVVENVDVGELITIRDGDKVPLDGNVISGSTFLDQAMLTGESTPVKKSPGDEVFAGTMNVGGGVLQVKVTKRSDESVVAKMLKLVEDATSNKSPTEQFVERVAAVYTPVILVLAIILCFMGIKDKAFIQYGLVLLVIGCPCALVISTPVTYVAGLAQAARGKVLVKGGVYLESVSAMKTLAVDKTGTMTLGKFSLLEKISNTGLSDVGMKQICALVKELEGTASHPIAVALTKALEGEKNEFEVVSMENVKGKGMSAIVRKTIDLTEADIQIEKAEIMVVIKVNKEISAKDIKELKIQWKSKMSVVEKTVTLMLMHNSDQDAIILAKLRELSYDVVSRSVFENVLECDDGCCKKDDVEIIEKDEWESVAVSTSETSCKKGCCGLTKKEPKLPEADCEKGCCSSKAIKPEKEEGDCKKGCCGPNEIAPEKEEDECKKGCCGPKDNIPKKVNPPKQSDKIEVLVTIVDKFSSEDLSLVAKMMKSATVAKIVDQTVKVELFDQTFDFNDSKPEDKIIQLVSEGFDAMGLDIKIQKLRFTFVVSIGNMAMCEDMSWKSNIQHASFFSKVTDQLNQGHSLCVFGTKTAPLVSFIVGDEIRPEAKQAVAELKKLGVEVCMLTGDHEIAAKNVSEKLGVSSYFANLLPEGKQSHVIELKEGKKKKKVGMIGDGINDSLSLVSADVSISMGKGGSSLAIETADVCLLEDNLMKLVELVKLSRKCVRKIRENVVFSVVIKVVVVVVTFAVPYPSLWLAILSDVGAMLLVTLNSMSVLDNRFKEREYKKYTEQV